MGGVSGRYAALSMIEIPYILLDRPDSCDGQTIPIRSGMTARDSSPATPPPATAWASSDPLGETLHSFRLEGVVYARSQLTAPWGVIMPPMPDCLMFHIVTTRHCTLEFGDGEA